MEKNSSKLSYILVAVVSAVLAVVLVFSYLVAFAGGKDNLVRGAKLMQAMHVIQDEFVTEPDMDTATDYAVYGMVQSLGDKWSRYMPAKEYAEYSLRRENNRRSIGVSVSPCEEGFLLEDVSRDTPAYNAGLVPGEKLTHIDGESLAGWLTAQIQERIQSYGDDSFTLTVLSAEGEERTVTLSTQPVFVSPINFRMIGDVGYVQIKNFSAGCAENAIAAIKELTEQGARALVFDVRYNVGGYVDELTALLDYLLPEGEIFLSRNRAGKEDIVYSDANYIDLPMAVIMNSDSYSAAELFAAQLSEYGAGVTVGEATTGKGRSQMSFRLFDGSAVHISQEAYLTSQGRDLAAEGGLAPDFPVEITDEEKVKLYYSVLDPQEDKQLQEALKILN